MNKLLSSMLLIVLVTMGIFAVKMYSDYYFFKDVKVINDKQVVLQKATHSLPVQAVIAHQNWGALQIDDEARLYELTTLLSKLEQQKKAVEMLKNESDFMMCTVTYLNGTQKKYFIDEALIKNDAMYDESYPKSTVIGFYTYLLSLFYTPERVAKFASKSDVITLTASGLKQTLAMEQKNTFIRTLQTVEELPSDQRWNYSEQSSSQEVGFVTIYQDKQQATYKSEDIIHITVFKGFFVIRYLGDPNGNVIYFAGDLTTFLPVMQKES
ncbi:MAG: DUF3919 family protein [Bacillota bacterium]